MKLYVFRKHPPSLFAKSCYLRRCNKDITKKENMNGKNPKIPFNSIQISSSG